MISRRALLPSILLAVVILSGAAVVSYTGPPVVFDERVLKSRSGSPLRTVYVYPVEALSETKRSRPIVVAIPPYSIPPEAMSIICVEVARRGGVCAIPDFFGKTPEESRQRMGSDSLEVMTEDVLTIVYSLWSDKFPFAKRIKTGVCGHSVGGSVTYKVGRREAAIKACVPIGMVTDFFEEYPKNMLFLSGLYDEIHSPKALLENLKNMEVTEHPENNVLYGDIDNDLARKVTIIPTTDHFIETFDPFLIRELLDWYALTLDSPQLYGGELREWRRRVAAFLFMVSASILYAVLMGRGSEALMRRLAGSRPGWLILRLQALPVIAAVLVLMAVGCGLDGARPVTMDLMLGLVLAQELVSFRSRGALRHPGVSPYRRMRSALFMLLALGAGTLLSFGIVSLPYYIRWPEMAAWYPVFVVNMAILFPMEVWGRSVPWFFTDVFTALEPKSTYWLLLGAAVLAPGAIARAIDRLAEEAMITVRARLKPVKPPWIDDEEREGRAQGTENTGEARSAESPEGSGLTVLKIAMLVLLAALLLFLGYRRVVEGMLTWETGKLAAFSMLKFAVLPFVIAALIIRTKAFRRISHLD